ncbi:beta-lactamase [Candidatus Koribacter versatilis Ellin345]|uniref:Beta-lactamase n=1 Tax=Koribacter versatilis (strain Ellin345) TaxID=204669 RepID=Q1IU33_KORVE|nr:serine hydrolase domain-containing protein [Candidatus Koribacter versatilis]ABF39617.1 beta-lactamase [Candidatus Koribacter versatilis Ellin345]
MRTLLVFASLLVSAGLFAAEPIHRLDGGTISPEQIDATVTRLMKAAEVPGLGVAVIDDGKVVYLKGYGFRDVEKKLPYTPDTVAYAASFTKSAFAYMVLQLVDERSLDLDRPVYGYLPKPLLEYDDYKDLAGDERWKKITARMLLSHTSGLPNLRRFEDDQKVHIHFEPGSRYAYSGEGLKLLQLVIETIAKQPLQQLMEKRVFEPFGMTRTSMVWNAEFEDNFANGYDENGRNLGPDRRKSAGAAGSMVTTIRDFSRFLQLVMHGDRLSPKMHSEMLKAQVRIHAQHEFPTFENKATHANDAIRLSYGLGWGLYWSPYGEAFFKEGHDDGWRNYTVAFSDSGKGMIIMTNSGNGEGIFKELLEAVLKDSFTPIEWEGYTPYQQLPPRQSK